MLQTRFAEGVALQSNGRVEIQLPDDNPCPLLILLQLVHGQFRKVARQIDLDKLTKIAVLVDKYELLGIAEVFIDYWLLDLEGTIPTAPNDTLILWICVAWVFKKLDIFQRVTQMAQLESKDLLHANELPIPQWVIGESLITDTVHDTKLKL